MLSLMKVGTQCVQKHGSFIVDVRSNERLTSNKLNPPMTPGTGFEPRPHVPSLPAVSNNLFETENLNESKKLVSIIFAVSLATLKSLRRHCCFYLDLCFMHRVFIYENDFVESSR